jgi:hypothetical protein
MVISHLYCYISDVRFVVIIGIDSLLKSSGSSSSFLKRFARQWWYGSMLGYLSGYELLNVILPLWRAPFCNLSLQISSY